MHPTIVSASILAIVLSLGSTSVAAVEDGASSAKAIPRFSFLELVEPDSVRPDCVSGPRAEPGFVVPLADPGLSSGDWLYFDQVPAVVTPDWKGPLRARNFALLGDFPQIQLSLVDGGPEHTFDRREMRTIEGDEVSFFDLEFPSKDFRDLPQDYRFDRSGMIRLRPTVPKSKVVRIDDEVQYSSHVVNIVQSWEGAGMYALPTREIAEIFYEHFSDSYEELAFVPARRYQSPQWGAYHWHVRNEAEGIGYQPMDESASWQGAENLLSVIVLFRGEIEWNYLSLHETGHQWGFFWDLFAAAGTTPQGSATCARPNHVPLVANQPSFLSSCLLPPLRIEKSKGRWLLGEAPSPMFFHPFQLYAMGLMEADEVPPLMLARKQASVGGSPRPGRRIKSSFLEVTIDDVIATYGDRVGPAAPAVWRRAYIVVTPNRLLTKKEMYWYNFLAKRLSDPDVTGVEGLDRIPSFEIATLGAMDLRTEIRPRNRSRVRGNFKVSYPNIGRRDFRGIVFDKKLSTRFEAGRVYVLAGKVNRAPYASITFEIGDKSFTAELGDDLRFSVPVVLSGEDRGPRKMTIWLGARTVEVGSVAPVYVE